MGLDVFPKETSICVIDETGKMCGPEAALCLRRGTIIKGAEQVKAPERGTVAGKAKAYSYVRFSTPDQIKGDSFERPTRKAAEYARGLELDTTLTFRNLGVSAFRGKNAQNGALKAFLDGVEQTFSALLKGPMGQIN